MSLKLALDLVMVAGLYCVILSLSTLMHGPHTHWLRVVILLGSGLALAALAGCAPRLIPLTAEEGARLVQHRDNDPNSLFLDRQCDWRLTPGGRPTVLQDGTRVYPAVWVFPPECGEPDGRP